MEFTVGEHYENLKGVYKVISIEGDAMRICWESNEEVDTTVTQQERIIQNMDRERQELEQNSRRASKAPSSYGQAFNGLIDTDFSEDVTGTTWRSRGSLGGAVTVHLSGFNLTMDSWSIYRMPTVLWAAREHRKRANTESRLQAKFILELNDDGLVYGFYIERPTKGESSDDWNGFERWLPVGDNEAELRKICADNDLVAFDRKRTSGIPGTVAAAAEDWLQTADGAETRHASLLDLSATVADTVWLDLIIGKHMSKEDAVAAGQPIAATIAGVFSALAAVYDAAQRPD